MPQIIPPPDHLQHRIDIRCDRCVLGNGETKVPEPLHLLLLGEGRDSFFNRQVEGKEPYRSAGNLPGILHLEGTGRGVSWIGEWGQALLFTKKVQPDKRSLLHVGLSPHLKCRWCLCRQVQWNIPDGSEVGCDGVSLTTITTGGTQNQLSVLIPEPEDRKSTRLNSSHVAISYAVFCLKKKTKT